MAMTSLNLTQEMPNYYTLYTYVAIYHIAAGRGEHRYIYTDFSLSTWFVIETLVISCILL